LGGPVRRDSWSVSLLKSRRSMLLRTLKVERDREHELDRIKTQRKAAAGDKAKAGSGSGSGGDKPKDKDADKDKEAEKLAEAQCRAVMHLRMGPFSVWRALFTPPLPAFLLRATPLRTAVDSTTAAEPVAAAAAAAVSVAGDSKSEVKSAAVVPAPPQAAVEPDSEFDLLRLRSPLSSPFASLAARLWPSLTDRTRLVNLILTQFGDAESQNGLRRMPSLSFNAGSIWELAVAGNQPAAGATAAAAASGSSSSAAGAAADKDRPDGTGESTPRPTGSGAGAGAGAGAGGERSAAKGGGAVVGTGAGEPLIYQLEGQLSRLRSLLPLQVKIGEQYAWNTKFVGEGNADAAGAPGPFRQAITLISSSLQAEAFNTISQRTASSGGGGGAAGAAGGVAAAAAAAAAVAGGDASAAAAVALDRRAPPFIVCPNGVNGVGADRNTLIINPAMWALRDLRTFHAIGVLFGVAIRTNTGVTVDLNPFFWKALRYGVEPFFTALTFEERLRELVAFDAVTANALRFETSATSTAAPTAQLSASALFASSAALASSSAAAGSAVPVASSKGSGGMAGGAGPSVGMRPLTESEFLDLRYTWTTYLSDGQTRVELLAGGRDRPVGFEERWRYAEAVLRARLDESRMALTAIADGMEAIVPRWRTAFELLSWQETELRICGQSTIDIALLKSRTRISGFSDAQVADFWAVLEGFDQHQRSRFIQFCWARTRLPMDFASTGMHMTVQKMNPKSKAAPDATLPEAQTCFFILSLPAYSSRDILRDRLLSAMTSMEIFH
jgi:hypothetical protein